MIAFLQIIMFGGLPSSASGGGGGGGSGPTYFIYGF